ncbi:cysteine-rich CWC family protein [Roseateles sp.]|uniref:cysteine-rich CWC family protein n=1 Tax=Roseateles sp. TaxID=1971397 RepID=UPI003BA61F5F
MNDSSALNPVLDDRCPRCGGSFHCGAADAHCDCFDLHLSPALRQQLAAEYSSCLCIACLKALSAAAADQAET